MESPENQLLTTCDDCDLSFTSVKSHELQVKSQKHKKEKDKNRQSQMKSLDGEEYQSPGNKTYADAEEYICNFCEITFTGIVPYTQHLKGGPHSKVLRRKKGKDDPKQSKDDSDSEPQGDTDKKEMVPEPYGTCFICVKQFNAPEGYLEHMRSKSHAARKSKLKILKKMSALSTHEDNDRDEDSKKDAEKNPEDKLGQEELKCEGCERIFTGAVAFAQHLKCKSRAKRKIRNRLQKELKVIEVLQLEDSSSSSEDQQQPEVLTCEICHKVFYGPETAKAHFKSKGHKRAMRRNSYFARKSKSVEQSGEVNVSLATKEATGNSSVSTDHTDGIQLPKQTGSIRVDIIEEKSSAPPLPVVDEERQPHEDVNDKMESKNDN